MFASLYFVGQAKTSSCSITQPGQSTKALANMWANSLQPAKLRPGQPCSRDTTFSVVSPRPGRDALFGCRGTGSLAGQRRKHDKLHAASAARKRALSGRRSRADSGARVDRLQVVHSAFCLSPSIDPAGRQLAPAAAASRIGAKSHARRACLLLPRRVPCPAPTTTSRRSHSHRTPGQGITAFGIQVHSQTHTGGGCVRRRWCARRASYFFRDPAGARRRRLRASCGFSDFLTVAVVSDSKVAGVGLSIKNVMNFDPNIKRNLRVSLSYQSLPLGEFEPLE
jgi:hypothetical protein